MSKAPTIDDQINDLFEVLAKQKEAVEHSKKEIARSWITNCSLQIPGNLPVNLGTANQDLIVDAVAHLIGYHDNIERAAAVLGVKVDSKINGYSIDDWISDCKKRIVTIGIVKQKEKLKELEARLDLIVSPEQRRALELAAISKLLQN